MRAAESGDENATVAVAVTHPAPGPGSGTALPRTLVALDNRAFRSLMVGWLASGTGYCVQLIAQNWLVLELTGSPTVVGIAMSLQLLPAVVLGLFAGAVTDLLPCRRIVLVTNASKAALAAAFAVLVATGRVQVWEVYVFSAALGVVYAIDGPARQSLLSEVVRPEHLRNAISMVSLAFQSGEVIGPFVGALIMSTAGTAYAFAFASATYLVPTLVALSLPPARTGRPVARRTEGWICDGLRFAVRTPTVLWPSVIVGLFGFFMVNLPATLAALVQDEFDTGPSGLGQLSTALAFGSLLGAVLTARRLRPLRLRTITGSAMALAVALLVAATAPSEMTLTVLLALVGTAYVALLTSAQTLVQLATAGPLRGRIIAAYLAALLGGGFLGGPALGLVTEHFGARVSLMLAGLVPAFVTLVIAHHLACVADLRLGIRTVSVRIHTPTLVSRGE